VSEATARYFTRKATGLVREAGARDTLVYNLFFGNPWLALVYVFLFAVPALSGANLIWSTFMCLALVIPFLLVYAFLSAAIPRSGGEYTYISRILHPAIAVMANLNITFFGIIFVGAAGGWFARWGIADFVRIVAVNTGNLSLLNFDNSLVSQWGEFVVGTLLILFFTLVFIRGMDTYLFVQRIAFVLGTIGLVAGALVLLVSSHASFLAGFNHYASVLNGKPDTVAMVNSAATKAGYAPTANNLPDSFRAVDWIFLALGYCYASTYIGGEIKRPARSQLVGMLGAAGFITVVMLVYFVLIDHVIGMNFIGALGSVTPGAVGLPDTPTFVELIASISTNPIVWAVVGFCFIFWTFTTMPVNILTATRNLLAWSLDGLAPKRLADVSDRFHSPVVSLVFVGALGIFWLWVYIFTTYTSVILLIFANVLTYLTTAVAAAFLPYRQPELFEASPVNWRWGGIPVVTIVGALATLTMAIMLWVIFADPTQGFSFSHPGNLIFNLVVFFGGAVYFYVVYLIRKAQGIDINLAFREIPVE
jgi:amino acid transporter